VSHDFHCNTRRSPGEQAVGTSIQIAGRHAEYMLAYAEAMILLPETLSYEQAAPIFCAGYTVWSGLGWALPQPGKRLAVIGIGGPGDLIARLIRILGSQQNSREYLYEALQIVATAKLKRLQKRILWPKSSQPTASKKGKCAFRAVITMGD